MNFVLSKTARDAKGIFLRKNPGRWPSDALLLDDILMLLDAYFEAREKERNEIAECVTKYFKASVVKAKRIKARLKKKTKKK